MKNLLILMLLVYSILLFGCGIFEAPLPIEELAGTWAVISASAKDDTGAAITFVPPLITGEIVLKANGEGFRVSITVGLFDTTTETTGGLWSAADSTLTLHAKPPEIYTYMLDGDILTLIENDNDGFGELVLQRK